VDLGAITLVATTVGSFAGVARWWRTPVQRWRRALAAAPTVPIADHVDQTLVRLVGRITSPPTLTAPLSGQPAVFYVTIVEQAWRGWVTIICEASPISFVIDDGTGRARIDTTDALFAFAAHDPVRHGPYIARGVAIDELLARYGRPSSGTASMRASERVLSTGDHVEVCGLPVREADPDGAVRVTGYRDLPPTRLGVVSAPRRPILVGEH
jgi:hypothetical protein